MLFSSISLISSAISCQNSIISAAIASVNAKAALLIPFLLFIRGNLQNV